MFRRPLCVVTDRLTEGDIHYPYDRLENGGPRAEWIERCLESGEIVDQSRSVVGNGKASRTTNEASILSIIWYPLVSDIGWYGLNSWFGCSIA